MAQLPETGFLRQAQILGDPKADPPSPPIIPVSKSSWWKGISNGRYPKPLKLAPNTTVWKVEDIIALISSVK